MIILIFGRYHSHEFDELPVKFFMENTKDDDSQMVFKIIVLSWYAKEELREHRL